ncbi:hypothetical protein AB0M11_08300 [Streptomyces sp. NPDC051987]|uniref:hypothetical protein n=1 Tax=Streptomyces sp. NPDC051987 TaxID=3155808 RepID=UPI00341FA97B
MNTRRVNTAADVINAALMQTRTAAGIALALESAQLLMSPETAAELEQLRTALAVSEQRSERRRIAWRMARSRAISTGGAADRYAARSRDAQEALQHMLFAVIAGQLALHEANRERKELRARVAELEAAPTTVYRAEHPDSGITLGHYGTREAARKHCETVLRREVGDETFLGWVPDDGSELAPEELCVGHDVECTGYIVTPLELASEYDEGADE